MKNTSLFYLTLICMLTVPLEAMDQSVQLQPMCYAPVIIHPKQQKKRIPGPKKAHHPRTAIKKNEPDYKKLYLELRFSELASPHFMIKFRFNNFDLREYKEFLNAGLDINFINAYGRTTLMESCIEGCADKEITEWLIKEGANVNIPGVKYNQNAAMISTLDTFGIKTDFFVSHPNLIVDQQDIKGNTLLLYLLFKPSAWFFLPAEIYKVRTLAQIETLLKRHANPRLANNDGVTPLQAAQNTKDPRAIQLIENALKQYK